MGVMTMKLAGKMEVMTKVEMATTMTKPAEKAMKMVEMKMMIKAMITGKSEPMSLGVTKLLQSKAVHSFSVKSPKPRARNSR